MAPSLPPEPPEGCDITTPGFWQTFKEIFILKDTPGGYASRYIPPPPPMPNVRLPKVSEEELRAKHPGLQEQYEKYQAMLKLVQE